MNCHNKYAMLSVPYFMTSLGFLRYHANANIEYAEGIANHRYDAVISQSHEATEKLCHGVMIDLFEQRARQFCKSDELLETALIYADHPRHVIHGFVDDVVPMIVEAHFYELVEEEAMEKNIPFNADFVQRYFANIDKNIRRVLSDIYAMDFFAGQDCDKKLPPAKDHGPS